MNKALYAVIDADGAHFYNVDEDQARTLIEHQAAVIDGKRRKIKLRLCVDHSTAKRILGPRYPIRGSSTIIVEHVGLQMMPVYQHHQRRCEGWVVI